MAAAGIDISGLELSPDMVAQARQRRADLPEQVRRRVTITEGDMRDLPADLGTGFRLISLPY
ncbi:MAG: class I SAM-dependent methyltransferase, partial [Candidatus Latescibacteria bacterium]|nr:class I SAM-dependent methyltransferase [Candidatus Latescibacterota bacterium]